MAAPPDALAPFPDRKAGSPGERQALNSLTQRLEGLGLRPLREGFVTVTSRAGVVFGHLVLAAPLALTSWWRPGWSALALALLVAMMWAEFTGRRVLRDYLPRGRSYNLVLRFPPSEELEARRVFFAYIDQPQSGQGLSRRLLASGAVCSALASASALARHLWPHPMADYVLLVAGGLLGLITAMSFLVWRSVRGRGGSPGVQTLLDLAETPPIQPGCEIVLAFCGAGHVYGAGLRALKRAHRHEWGPKTRYVHVGDRSVRELLEDTEA